MFYPGFSLPSKSVFVSILLPLLDVSMNLGTDPTGQTCDTLGTFTFSAVDSPLPSFGRGFAPHRLDHPMICSVSIYGKYSGAIRGNLRLDDHWSLAVGRESQQLPKGTHVEAWEAFVGARWSTGDDCEAVNPCNQLLHCLA
jgi:hypothetical protein